MCMPYSLQYLPRSSFLESFPTHVGARLIIYLLASQTPTLFAIERQQLQNSWSTDVMSGNAYQKGEANEANKC